MKISIYCNNPECFNHYLANHKIRCAKEFQLSDYAWNEPQKKMIQTFLAKFEFEIKKKTSLHPSSKQVVLRLINKLAGNFRK